MLRGIDMLGTTQDTVVTMLIKPAGRAADILALARLLDRASS